MTYIKKISHSVIICLIVITNTKFSFIFCLINILEKHHILHVPSTAMTLYTIKFRCFDRRRFGSGSGQTLTNCLALGSGQIGKKLSG